MATEPGRVEVRSADELRRWLEVNHERSDSIWLVTYKKHCGDWYVGYDEIVDECLCVGWVDSAVRRLDRDRSMLRLSPRNPRSHWSGSNKRRVARLRREGRMQPAGLAMVALAKRSGSWTFLDDVERLEIPNDLAVALDASPGARGYFERFPASSRRGILEWIKTAKTASTRARRVEDTASKAAENRKANHPAGRDHGPVDTRATPPQS